MAEYRDTYTLEDRASGAMDRLIQTVDRLASRMEAMAVTLERVIEYTDSFGAQSVVSVDHVGALGQQIEYLNSSLASTQRGFERGTGAAMQYADAATAMAQADRLGAEAAAYVEAYLNGETEAAQGAARATRGLLTETERATIAQAKIRAALRAEERALAAAEMQAYRAAEAMASLRREESREEAQNYATEAARMRLAAAEERAAQQAERHAQANRTVTRTFAGMQNPLERTINKMARMVLYFFSIRKLISYIKNSMERAPDEIAAPFTELQNTLNNLLAGPVVALMDGMRAGVERLNAAFASEAGQKFMRGLEAAARGLGTAISFAFNLLAEVVEFVGNNFQLVLTLAIGILGVFAAQMIAAGIATVAANAPLYIMIGAVTALIAILAKFGVTGAQVFGFIAGGIAAVGAVFADVVLEIAAALATIGAAIGALAVNLVTALHNSIYSVQSTAMSALSNFLSFVAGVAKALNSLPFVEFDYSGIENAASKYAQKAAEARNSKWEYKNVTDWANSAANAILKYEIDPMEAFRRGQSWGEGLGENLLGGFSDFALSTATPQAVKSLDSIDANVGSIGGSVKNIEKAVTMSDEELKMLVDMAEHRLVNQVNLTSQTPVINVTGANTGNNVADRRAIADAIMEILVEQTASGSVRSTAMV